MVNTYPCNPFPISSEQLHKGDNEDLQAQIDAIKDGTAIDSFGDVETALTTKADNDVIAPEFDAEAGTYEIGDLVMYEGKLYEFTSAHETAGEWDSTEVTEKTVADEIGAVKSGLIDVNSKVNRGTVSVTPDGIKSFSQLFDALFALIDSSKINGLSVLQMGGNYFNCSYISSYFEFTSINHGTAANNSFTNRLAFAQSGSVYTRCYFSGNFEDNSNIVPTANEFELVLHY